MDVVFSRSARWPPSSATKPPAKPLSKPTPRAGAQVNRERSKSDAMNLRRLLQYCPMFAERLGQRVRDGVWLPAGLRQTIDGLREQVVRPVSRRPSFGTCSLIVPELATSSMAHRCPT
jgi:hypothetical protein